MQDYHPLDVTERARRVASENPLGEAAPHPPGKWPDCRPRIPHPSSLDPSRGRKHERVRSIKTRTIEFGSEEIDVSLIAQIVDPAQCRLIGDILLQLSRKLCDGIHSIPQLLEAVEAIISHRGLEVIAEQGFGDRALARRFEVAAALNRLRSLRLVED
jgi:hypothetical protein